MLESTAVGAAHGTRRIAVVAADQQGAHAQGVQLVDRFAGAGLDRVAKGQGAGRHPYHAGVPGVHLRSVGQAAQACGCACGRVGRRCMAQQPKGDGRQS